MTSQGGDPIRIVHHLLEADLRGEAIGQLGVLGARAELYEMYQAESEVKVKKKILDALFVGGAADKISDLAQNEKMSLAQ